jgi:hypothetical protein
MKYPSYGAAKILTSDAAASAVLHYAAILARTRDADVVDVPTSDADGLLAYASVVLDPGVPVMAENAPDDALEEEDRDFVDELTARVGLALADASRRGSDG